MRLPIKVMAVAADLMRLPIKHGGRLPSAQVPIEVMAGASEADQVAAKRPGRGRGSVGDAAWEPGRLGGGG